jgi:hypothetical protein
VRLAAYIEKGMTASQFPTLICSYESAVGETMCHKKLLNDVQGWFLAPCEEHPDVTRRLVNDKKIRGVAVMGEDHPVAPFCTMLVEFRGGSAEKSKVHIEATFAFRNAKCRALDRQFADPSLFFEVDESEGMVGP